MAENNHNNDDLRAIRRGILAAVLSEGVPGKLGRRDGQLNFTDATGTTYRDRVWVTLDGAKANAEVVARNNAVPRIFNLPVRVSERNGVHTIIGIDGPYTSQYSGGRPVATAEHAWMHGRLAPDPLYVSGLQVLPLMATPTTPPSMAVTVTRAQYRYGGTLKLFDTGDSADLSAYIPASSSNQHFVVICLDRANNVLVVVDGADSSAGGDAFQQPGTYNQPFTAAEVAAISIDDAYYPICAVRLYYGMTRILAPDIIFDCRLWAGEAGGAVDAGDITSGTLALEHGGTEANLSATGPGLVQQRTAGAALSVVLCKFDGTAAPGVGDDEGDGYSVGSRWLDVTNDKEYVCLDASTGAAVWIETTGGGALADHDHSGDAGDGGTFDAANLTSGAATDGHVLTADGAGGAAWEDAGESGDIALLFSQVADAVAADTTDETSLIGPGRGNASLAAGVLKVGSTVRIKLSGYLSDTGNPTMDIKVKVGGAEVCSTGAQNLDTSVSEVDFHAEVLITCRSTGASGSVVASGLFEHDNGTSFGLTKTSATTVDTTGALDLGITATWGTANASNTITSQICTIELITASDDLAPAAPGGLTATQL